MLRSLKDLMKYSFAASDGALGSISDVYFDDWEWCIRYMVIDTGKWLPGREVLISPVSIGQVDSAARELSVELTQDQVKNSPGLETDKPVSRQREVDLATYYGWPYYWGARLGGGAAAAESHVQEKIGSPESDRGDPNLRSVKEVTGYNIDATDGEIGHVEEFIVDDEDWTIRYMVVDTRNWLPGKKVLVAPWMIRSVRWDEAKVHVDMTREHIRHAPEYDPSETVNRRFETRWYDYYGRQHYWETSES